MEIQQSPEYASFIRSIGWQVDTVDGINLFSKKLPFTGRITKTHRPDHFPDAESFIKKLTSIGTKILSFEPVADINENKFHTFIHECSRHFRIHRTPFLPTKTIRINLEQSEDKIFHSYSEAKRRAVRKAIKNGCTVRENPDISDILKIKATSAGLFGFITTHQMEKLKVAFKENCTSILSYKDNSLLGGILILFYDRIAYYWIAGTIKSGKLLAAPTLLVWEAIKLSKKRGMQWFDFVGVWDERRPKENLDWKGFTKFKEGFGGETVYYPILK